MKSPKKRRPSEMSGGLLSILIFGALVAYPFSRILPKYGLSPWFALVAVVPLGAIILLWVLAFREPVAGA